VSAQIYSVLFIIQQYWYCYQ